MINSGYWIKVYCLNPVKNAASARLAANMKSESWMAVTGGNGGVTGMFTSDENVPIEEFEWATFQVTDADICAARMRHGPGVHKCNHDN